MNLKLAIVILNWNGKKFLEKFLPPLMTNTPDYAEIIIADNASTDDSVIFIKETFPNLKIIQNSENGGFAKGYNDALKQIEAQYYCLLNSDIEVSPHWVEPIMERMDSDFDIAAVQPKLRSYYRRKEFEYAGAAGGFIDKLGYPFCRGRVFESVEEDKGQYESPMDVFWATGAALFIRSDIYHKMNGLDEDFFAHMEEIDLCWRIKNAGYRIVAEPQSVIYHVGGGTLSKNNPQKTFLNFRNNYYLLIKNLPDNRLFTTLLSRLFLDNAAAFMFLCKGQFRDFLAVYKAHLAVFKNYRYTKNKRRGQTFDAYGELYPQTIIFQYYFKRKKNFDGIRLF